LNPPNKTPEQIEERMAVTRESITEKVAALENQVIGTFQTAATTVSETVGAVKEAVEAVKEAPAAVGESVKNTVEAVKESISSFSVSRCVQTYPSAAILTSMGGGFVLGFLFGGPQRRRSIPAPAFTPREIPAPVAPPAKPGFLGSLLNRLGEQFSQIIEEAANTAMKSLRESVSTHVPEAVDSAVEGLTDRVRNVTHSKNTVGSSMNGR